MPDAFFKDFISCNFYALSEDAIQILYKKLKEDKNNESK
nr:MAG TPA: hypothetical protein [Bacteriophage sp.]